MRTISMDALKSICLQISERLGLSEKGLHVAALFQDNEHDEVMGWAVLDQDNKIVERYYSLEKLFEKYEGKS